MAPPPPPHGDTLHGNGNYNQNLTINGAITTLAVSIGLFLIIQAVFEYTRFYKQIHLKRLQKKFQELGRVPPPPPNVIFGWLYTIMKISENDILRMVGLDAYMLLRYITICFKLAVFMSFWGLLILVPLYSTASIAEEWDKYTLENVIESSTDSKFRLWAAAIFGYLFSAYFCQLLYAEYGMFSSNRLKYLVQADPDSLQGDPDTPPQKYFTVMIERIPPHLRSAVALHKFFENLFPGEVYTVEISLDLTELNKVDAQRKEIRDRLEQAIAFYEASNCRPEVYIQTGNINMFADSSSASGRAAETFDNFSEFFQKLVAPEAFGFENKDALTYFTDKLVELNSKCEQLQLINYDFARKCDKDLEKKIRNRHDTRAAALLQTVASSGSMGINLLKSTNVETWLFGPEVEDFKTVSDNEKLKVEVLGSNGTGDHIAIGATATEPAAASVAASTSSRRPSAESAASAASATRRRSLSAASDAQASQHGSSNSSTNLNDVSMTTEGGGPLTDYDRSQFSSFVSAQDYLRQDSNAFVAMHSYNNPTTAASASSKTPRLSSLDAIFQPIEDESKDDHLLGNDDLEAAEVSTRRYSGNGQYGALKGEEDNEEFVEKLVMIEGGRSSSPVVNPLLAASTSARQNSISSGTSMRPSISMATRSSSIKPFSTTSTEPVIAETDSNPASPNQSYAALNELDQPEIQAVGGGERSPSINFGGSTARRPSGQPQQASSSSAKRPSFGNSMVIRNPLHSDNDANNNYNSNGIAPNSVIDMKYKFMTPEQLEQANEIAKLGAKHARVLTKEGWEQTKNATSGAWKGMLEVERAAELIFIGAYNKYSTTAFVTFNSRVTESIAHQMLLSHESMEISHAPNPHDIIWDNVAIPKSQISMRSFIINVGLCVGSLFWSSLVNAINSLGVMMNLSEFQQQYMSVVVMLGFLFSLPVLFDALARYYEGMKLESEIQNSIMQRYFYYQLVNIYVTVGLGTQDIFSQIYNILRKPQILVNILSRTVPSVSLYFLSLVIVKIFVAVPMELVRPWQLSTIMTMQTVMDKRKCTRRDLRTGAFYAWPMLYGWVYPQLMLVLIIQVTYSCIAPLLMPLCAVFFVFAYLMYKYQLLYVYINDYQSGGFMWYDVFTRSLIALLFASLTLLGYLSLELQTTYYSGPFYFLIPLPIGIVYFWRYTEDKFKKQSMNLPLEFAKELDIRNRERSAAGKSVPHDVFTRECYRQPSLTQKAVYPEPFRDSTIQMYTVDNHAADVERGYRARKGSLSLNVAELVDDGENDPAVLKSYFEKVVLPLAHPNE